MLRPLQDRILVQLDENLQTGISGFVLPPKVDAFRAKDGAVEGMNRGTVVAVGPGKRHPKTLRLEPCTVNPGDVVRFSELQYHEHKQDGKRYVLIQEADILMVEEVEVA